MFKGYACFSVAIAVALTASAIAAPLARTKRLTNDQKVQIAVFKYMIQKTDARYSHGSHPNRWQVEYVLSLGGHWVEATEGVNKPAHQIDYPMHNPSKAVMTHFIHHLPLIKADTYRLRFQHEKAFCNFRIVHIRWMSNHDAIVQEETFGSTPGMEGTADWNTYDVMYRRNHWSVVKSESNGGAN